MKPVAWRYCDSFKPVIWHLTKDAKEAAKYRRKGWVVRPLKDMDPETTTRYIKKDGRIIGTRVSPKLDGLDQ